MRARDASLTLKVMPRNQETGVPRDTTLLVTAPRRFDHRSTSGLRVRSDERDVEGILEVSTDGRILFWRPVQTLDAHAEHQVRISGVRDDRGALFDDFSSTFITGFFSYVDLQLLAE